ncbi:MAG TPA: TonB-dependent receptor [Thermoanaerobaculia bacterium]|nr:TonB-dependent receptor [Thermoanaerobaculia bacterium]
MENRRIGVWAAVLALSVGGAVAFAQESTTPPAATQEQPAEQQEAEEAPEQRPVTSEEITVTATLREQTIQEVPFSVAAPTGEELRAKSVESIEGVAQNVAGFTVQNLGQGQSQVSMRGVSAGQIVRDQPGVKEQVGVYLDDSVISLSLFTPDIDLFDMNRVEVLRGPQGTLFGSGSLSGTVRYITNQPELGVSESFGEFSASSIDGGDAGGTAKVAANVPFGDHSAMRVALYYNEIGGFIDALQPRDQGVREDYNSSQRTGLRLTYLYQPNEKLSIKPRLIYQEVASDGRNQVDAYNILGNPYTTTRPQVHLDEREQVNQIDEPFTDELVLVDLNIGYQLGSGLALTSITTLTDRDILAVRDAGALTSSITGGSIGLPEDVYLLDSPLADTTSVRSLTEELRLAGSRDRLTWLVGAFYSSIDRDYAQALQVDAFEALTGIPTAGVVAPKDNLYFSGLQYQFDQLALFGEATWSINDRFDLTGGLRYYDHEEDRIQVFDGIFAGYSSNPGSTTADGFAPRLIASYELTAATSLNAQVSKGFRLGGINDPLNEPLCEPQDLVTYGGHPTWEDEELWNYEIGSKSTILGGRGTLNVSAYYMDIDGLQATLTAGSCSSRIVVNVPKARSTGVELELGGSTSEHFDYSIAASYNNAELRSTFVSAGGDLGIKSGNRLPTVPELQVVAAATYRWHMANSRFGYATGTYQHVGSRFTQIGDQAAGFGTVDLNSFGPVGIGGPFTQSTFTFDPELPAYDLFNARVGVISGSWDVALFVNNVTDERALLSLDQERGTLARVGYLTNQPRSFGLNALVHF